MEQTNDANNQSVELSTEQREYLDEVGSKIEYELELRRLLYKHNNKVGFLIHWGNKNMENRRLYRHLLLGQLGILQQNMYEALNHSERTIRRRLNELEEKGIIERSGSPKTISVKNEELYILMSDAREFIFNGTI